MIRPVLFPALLVTFGTAMALTGCRAESPAVRGGAPMMHPMSSSDTATPDTTLDALHDAASRAEFDRYFALFAPEAVFLGTDATERWTLEEFKAYTRPFFSQGRGWTYVPSDRHVSFGADGHTAWFDERVTSAKYGECRGTGVLVRTADGWRISQYNLTKPIPNDLFDEVVARIRASRGGS